MTVFPAKAHYRNLYMRPKLNFVVTSTHPSQIQVLYKPVRITLNVYCQALTEQVPPCAEILSA